MKRTGAIRAALQRHRMLLAIPVVASVASVATVLVLTMLDPAHYSASAKIQLGQRASEAPFDPATGVMRDQDRLLSTQADLVTSQQVEDRVRLLIGSAPSVSASALARTDVVVVGATTGKPRTAADIANAYAIAFIEQRRTSTVDELLRAAAEVQRQVDDVDRQLAVYADQPADAGGVERQALVERRTALVDSLDQLQVSAAVRDGSARLIALATVPASPDSRHWPFVLAGGVLAGLAIGAVAVMVASYLAESIVSESDLPAPATAVPILGRIPELGTTSVGRKSAIPATDPSSPGSEAFRSLRTSIRFIAAHRPMQVIHVTSASPSEGKSSIVANLAIALAATGQRVCAVCCDLRRPRLHEYLGGSLEPGVSNVLGGASLEDALQAVAAVPNLSLLAAGTPVAEPAELLASPAATHLVKALQGRYDAVLIDSPPAVPLTDATLLALHADATVVVVAMGRTIRQQLTRSLEVLAAVDRPAVGLVLNRAEALADYRGHDFPGAAASGREAGSVLAQA